MTDKDLPPQFQWERSPDYRSFYSNNFMFRFSAGDGSITFSRFTETPGAQNQNVVLEQVNIHMSWATLKMLGEYVMTAVQEIEREVGPIVYIGLPKEELRKQTGSIIKSFVIQKK